MSYLKSLQETKESRERYELGVIKLKELIIIQENLHNLYNGQFLADLQEFLTNYKPKE